MIRFISLDHCLRFCVLGETLSPDDLWLRELLYVWGIKSQLLFQQQPDTVAGKYADHHDCSVLRQGREPGTLSFLFTSTLAF